jgi:hypothetical protein
MRRENQNIGGRCYICDGDGEYYEVDGKTLLGWLTDTDKYHYTPFTMEDEVFAQSVRPLLVEKPPRV